MDIVYIEGEICLLFLFLFYILNTNFGYKLIINILLVNGKDTN